MAFSFGVVDGADFLELQRGFGTIYDATDLADWEANYGMVAPLSAASAAVPEPASMFADVGGHSNPLSAGRPARCQVSAVG